MSKEANKDGISLNPELRKRLQKTPLILVGYGAQGRAEAVNLRRSQIPFVLALREKGSSWQKALLDGFSPQTIEEALAQPSAPVAVALNIPDQEQASFFREFLAGKISRIRFLIFAHGFNIHFGFIPKDAKGPTHLLVAPKGAASGLIEFYGTSTALPAILATENSKEESAEKLFAEAYALAIGAHPKGLVWARFKDETECDLFSEQVLLCGGISSLLRSAYEVLVEAGYSPETAYFETLYELKLIVDLMWKGGITGMRSRISPTARYGDITRGDRVIDESVKKRMREVLGEIQSGVFAREFLKDLSSKEFQARESQQNCHPIEEVGQRLRNRLGF